MNDERPDDAAKRERMRQANEARKFVMDDPRGRLFIWALLGDCGIFTNSFNTNFGQTSFNLGRQSIGQTMLRELTAQNPAEYLAMQSEAMEREKMLRNMETIARERKENKE